MDLEERRIRAAARRLAGPSLPPWLDADDLAQEARVALLERPHAHAYRSMVDSLRRSLPGSRSGRRAWEGAWPDHLEPMAEPLVEERRAPVDVVGLLELLTPRQRRIVEETILGERTATALALELDVDVSAVCHARRRALAKMRAALC